MDETRARGDRERTVQRGGCEEGPESLNPNRAEWQLSCPFGQEKSYSLKDAVCGQLIARIFTHSHRRRPSLRFGGES